MLIRYNIIDNKISIWSNTATLIYGPSGSGKTIFSLFAMDNILKIHEGMYLQIIENMYELENYINVFRLKIPYYIRNKKAVITSFDDSDLLLFVPGKFQVEILSRIINVCNENNYKLVFFDGMEYIRNSLPHKDYLFILYKLISVFRKNKISPFIIQQNADFEKCLFDNIFYLDQNKLILEKVFDGESKEYFKKISKERGFELK